MRRYFLTTDSGYRPGFNSLSAAMRHRDRHAPLAPIFDHYLNREVIERAPPRAAPNGPQKYRGCQEHGWELVVLGEDAKDRDDVADRLRVPGGWLYRNGPRMVFVPMPEAVGYEV